MRGMGSILPCWGLLPGKASPVPIMEVTRAAHSATQFYRSLRTCGSLPPYMRGLAPRNGREAWLSPRSASPAQALLTCSRGRIVKSATKKCGNRHRQLGVSSRHECGGGRWRWPIAIGQGSHFRITWISPAGFIRVGVLHGYWMTRRSTNIHCRIISGKCAWIGIRGASTYSSHA
jgi:hypothetical protein